MQEQYDLTIICGTVFKTKRPGTLKPVARYVLLNMHETLVRYGTTTQRNALQNTLRVAGKEPSTPKTT